MRVPAEDLNVAVIGEVRAAIAPALRPENWVILPTVRFGELICAEVTPGELHILFRAGNSRVAAERESGAGLDGGESASLVLRC